MEEERGRMEEERGCVDRHKKMKMESTKDLPPSMSGDKKVAGWLQTLEDPAPIDSDSIVPSSDYGSMSDVSSQADSDQDFCDDIEKITPEKITPEKLSRGRLQVQLEGEGRYECELTGLIFEAKEPVVVRYSGPIFNVRTVDKDASALKSIQFPHSLCLSGQKTVTGKHSMIENSGSHLKWQVSSLSPVGSIALDTQQVEHNGAVLVYEDLWSSNDTHTFRIYLALNCSSWHEDIKKKLELERGRYRWVDKNPSCQLVEGKYRLMSEPRGEIHSEALKFTLAQIEFRGFFEAFCKEQPPFTFYLKASGTDVTAWSAKIQQAELKKQINQFQLDSSKSKSKMFIRQRSASASGEVITSKRHSLLPVRKQRSEASGEDITSKRHFLLHEPGAEEPQITQTPEMKATFVKNHTCRLIQRITEVLPIADYLRVKGVFTNETYNEIRGGNSRQAQSRALLDIICLKGTKATSEFYDALQKHDSFLFEDLAGRPGT